MKGVLAAPSLSLSFSLSLSHSDTLEGQTELIYSLFPSHLITVAVILSFIHNFFFFFFSGKRPTDASDLPVSNTHAYKQSHRRLQQHN